MLKRAQDWKLKFRDIEALNQRLIMEIPILGALVTIIIV